MAVLTKHVLGVPSGKLGDSIAFSTWKGKATLRSLPTNYSDPNTLAQQEQRIKFAIVAFTITPLADIIKIGWKNFSKTGNKALTSLNAYASYHLTKITDFFLGEAPDYYGFDPLKLLISRGTLQPPTGISSTTLGLLPEYPDDKDQTDISYIVIYDYDNNFAVFQSATVEQGAINISKPSEFSDNCYLYVFTTNKKGDKVSNPLVCKYVYS